MVPNNDCLGYDTKQSDGEGSEMLELSEIPSAPSFASLPDPLGPGVLASDRVLSIGQIDTNYVFMRD